MPPSESGSLRHVRRNVAYDKYCELVQAETQVLPRWTHFRAVSTNQYILADALIRVIADVLNFALRKFGMGSQFATFWMHLEISEEHLAKLQTFWLCHLLAHACEQVIDMKNDAVDRYSASSNALEYCIKQYLNEIDSGSKPVEMSILWTDCAVLSGTYAIESHVDDQALRSLTRSLQVVTKWMSVSAESPQCENSESHNELQKTWHDLHLKWAPLGPVFSDSWDSRMYCILIESACLDLNTVVETYSISYLAWHQWLARHFPHIWQSPEDAQGASLPARELSSPSPSRMFQRSLRHQSVHPSPRQYRPVRGATVSGPSAGATESTHDRIGNPRAQSMEHDRALAPAPSEVLIRMPRSPHMTEHELRETRFLASHESLLEVSIPPSPARQEEIRAQIAGRSRPVSTASPAAPNIRSFRSTDSKQSKLSNGRMSLHGKSQDPTMTTPLIGDDQQARVVSSPNSRASEHQVLGRRASAAMKLRRLSRWVSLRKR